LYRSASPFLRSAQQLHAQAASTSWDGFRKLATLWEALALVQHHDAITGDSYQNVMDDFSAMVSVCLIYVVFFL
jgi:hypothetical protein